MSFHSLYVNLPVTCDNFKSPIPCKWSSSRKCLLVESCIHFRWFLAAGQFQGTVFHKMIALLEEIQIENGFFFLMVCILRQLTSCVKAQCFCLLWKCHRSRLLSTLPGVIWNTYLTYIIMHNWQGPQAQCTISVLHNTWLWKSKSRNIQCPTESLSVRRIYGITNVLWQLGFVLLATVVTGQKTLASRCQH